MRSILGVKFLILILTACSNVPEMETAEIRTFYAIREALINYDASKTFIDARNLIDRKKVDKFSIPILFVELETGQNGTLTPYPGFGIGQTWLGADGATVTLENGFLISSRGMGNDIMGTNFEAPKWHKITDETVYKKNVSYLSGNNQLEIVDLDCKIKKISGEQILNIWEVDFTVIRYDETCLNGAQIIKNTYFVENFEVIRKSIQYHSGDLGYLKIVRLDRNH